MKKRSIIKQSIIIILLVMLVFSITADLIITNLIENSIARYVNEQVEVITTSLEWAVIPFIVADNDVAIARIIENVASNEMVDKIRIQGYDGTVYYASDVKEIGQIIPNLCVAKVFETRELIKQEINIPNDIYRLAVPVREEGDSPESLANLRYVLYLDVNVKFIRNVISQLEIGFQIAYSVVMLIIVGVIIYVIYWRIGKPINYMRNIFLDKSSGDKEDMLARRSDEFGEMMRAHVAMIQDIEDKQRALENAMREIEETSNAKVTFLANMSHEIRTPLNAVIGFTDILLEDETDKDKLKNIEIIKRSGEHLHFLVDSILDFSKLADNKITLEKIEVDVRQLIDQMINVFYVSLKEKSLSIAYRIEKNVPYYFFTDKHRLQQILINLLSNAIKFSRENEQIEVILSYNHQLVITVTDHGIGIPDAKQEKIFEPFKQSDQSVTRVFGGTGLGLSIVKEIAVLMGGDVSVHSKVGVGSTFTVELPLDYKNEALNDEELVDVWIHLDSTRKLKVLDVLEQLSSELAIISDNIDDYNETRLLFLTNECRRLGLIEVVEMLVALRESITGEAEGAMIDVLNKLMKLIKVPQHHQNDIVLENEATLSILIVDDIEENRYLLASFLKNLNFPIFHASNGVEALSILETRRIDLLLLDMYMPELDGEGVLKALEEKEQLRPRYIVSTSGDDHLPEAMKVDTHLVKPIKKEALLSIVESMKND